MTVLEWVLAALCAALLGTSVGLAVGNVKIEQVQQQTTIQNVYQIQESANISLVNNRLVGNINTNGTNMLTHIYLPEAILMISITNHATNIVTNWNSNSMRMLWEGR